MVVDAVPIMIDAQKRGVKILVEGAQAVMLDISAFPCQDRSSALS